MPHFFKFTEVLQEPNLGIVIFLIIFVNYLPFTTSHENIWIFADILVN